MMTSRWAITSRRGYVDWITTLTHEYFHAWNVKRLRPVELGPFDYERENVTRMLWAAEGLTEYYGDAAPARAGVIARDECLGDCGDAIAELQSTPGRFVTPVEQGVGRRLDPLRPAGRELAERVDQLLHEGRGDRDRCSTPRSGGSRTTRDRWTM